MNSYPLSAVQLCDPFWKEIQDLVRTVVLPYQWEILNDCVEGAEPSYCIRNFRIAAGDLQGKRQGTVFLDTDVYKWLEAVAYGLTIQPDEMLEACADEAIRLIGRAQCADGYLDTYYAIQAPGERFRNLTEGHELYCAGHLFEAAVAYHQATGKIELLNIAIRLAECLVNHFQPQSGENRGYPGHSEVELALVRLYSVTSRADFLELAEYFVNQRGVGKSWRDTELERGGFTHIWDHLFDMPLTYAQAHLPVREQKKAAGHAVRAMYLYSAMADLAGIRGDQSLEEACRALFENVTRRQMYITGGIGSAAYGEQFTTDYDLPNDTVYAETCASVGLMMFAARMWRLTGDPACYDVWERALNNTVLAGMGKDGKHFFYVNPLAVDPKTARENPGLAHVRTERPRWFGVACCPTNLARAVLSLGASLYAQRPGELVVLSHLDSILRTADGEVSLAHERSEYCLSVSLPPKTLKLRVPDGFSLQETTGQMEDGYLCIAHPGGKAAYRYRLTPEIRILHAHPRIAHDAGKVCVCYGQMVYCLEEADNGKVLCALQLPRGAVFEPMAMDWLPQGMTALRTQGFRLSEEGWVQPYAASPPEKVPVSLVFIPYSQWNNRGEGEMCCWVNEAY